MFLGWQLFLMVKMTFFIVFATDYTTRGWNTMAVRPVYLANLRYLNRTVGIPCCSTVGDKRQDKVQLVMLVTSADWCQNRHPAGKIVFTQWAWYILKCNLNYSVFYSVIRLKRWAREWLTCHASLPSSAVVDSQTCDLFIVSALP